MRRRFVAAQGSEGFDWGPYPGVSRTVWILMFPLTATVWIVTEGACLLIGHRPENVGPTELFCERCSVHLEDKQRSALK